MKPLWTLGGIALALSPLALLWTSGPGSAGCGCAPDRPAPMIARGDPPKAEILWDTYGVPHIFAADDRALFYAYGWAQMEAHGDLVLRLYAQARGRAAEYWGKDYLDGDRHIRRFGVPARAGDWLSRQSPEALGLVEAFVAGMNERAARHPEGLDPQRRVVLPVQPVDVLAHVQRTLYLLFVAEEEAERAQDRFMEKTGGSNAWAIAPARSASGKALLVANPHLPWSDLFTWFEAHLVAPGLNASGASLVGQNLLGIGFNEHLGWTHTVNTIDGADAYELTLKDGGYLFDGAVRPFETETQTLKVRQEDGTLAEEKLLVKRSVHGPIIAEKGGKAVALRVAGLAPGLDQSHLTDERFRLLRSRNFGEFEDAVRTLQMPMFTTMYADREGHIFHLFGGHTPIRPSGNYDWSRTVPGDSSKTLWTATHPFADLPRVLDPPSGWLQNANDPPWTTTFPPALDPGRYPSYMAPRQMGFRPQRSVRMLAEDDRITWDELLADKHSTRMELADRILDDLAAAVKEHGTDASRRGLAVLDKWDRTADNASRGGVLFQEWTRTLRKQQPEPFAVKWSEARPRETPDGLSNPKAAATALDVATREVEKTYGATDVPWGDVHRLRRDGVDLPANGGSGSLGIFRVTDYRKDDDARYRVVGGDSFVAVVEFTTPPRARTLVAYGNWSQRGSKHRTDQLALYSKKELKPAWLTRAEVEANLEKRETF